MIGSLFLAGLVMDLVAAFLLYWGKIFRNRETIEKMSTKPDYEIEHRSIETRLARLGAILLISGFFVQIMGYIIGNGP